MSVKIPLMSNKYIARHRFTLRGYGNWSTYMNYVDKEINFCAMGL